DPPRYGPINRPASRQVESRAAPIRLPWWVRSARRTCEERSMIGKLILTHGGLARELLAAAQVISGRLAGIEALSLDWNDTFEEAKAKVRAALDRLDDGHGVLILTDMYGGTPSNVAVTFLQNDRVEVLTGVNLPMVLRLACL